MVLVTVEPFVCGGASACFASFCIHPIDLAKVRLQLWTDKVKPGFLGILGKMWKEEGFSSLYSGLSASLMRQAVYGTARIGLHRHFSEKLTERNNGYDNYLI